jgi:predicted dehydrogenase
MGEKQIADSNGAAAKPIRTAVVGLNMGSAHAHAYRMSSQSELRWVVDLDEERAASMAEQLGCGYTTDWRRVLEDDVDAVSLATPHHLHAPMALEAIAAGKHILMEKPLANSEADCLKLIEAAERQGVVLMLAYIVRYRPAVQLLRALIESEQYGKPFSANCWVEGYLPPQPPESWFSRQETLGGGVLYSHGCHYIDLLLSLFGTPVQAKGLGTRSGTEWLEGEGTHHSILKFEGGAVAHLGASWGMKFRDTPALLHLHTPEACLVLSGNKLEVITQEGRKTLYEPEGPVDGNARALGEVEHFLACIRTGRRPLTDGAEALKSHRLIWDLYAEQRL